MALLIDALGWLPNHANDDGHTVWHTNSNNNTDSSESHHHAAFPIDTHVAKRASIPMLFTNGIAVIACIWFCTTVWRRPALHNVMYYALIGQSLTDLSWVLYNFIAGLTALPSGIFPGNCQLSGWFNLFVISGSVWSFCLVAWARRIAVMEARAGRPTVLNGVWVLKRQMAGVGICGFFTGGAVLVGGGLQLAPDGRYCWSALDDDVTTNIIVLLWLICLIFISGCYVSIYRQVVEVRKMVSMRNDQISRRVAAEGSLAFRMVIAVIVFIVAYIPAMTQTVICGAGIESICGNGSLDLMTEAGMVILIIVNPLMYVAMDSKLRLEARSQWLHCRRVISGGTHHSKHRVASGQGATAAIRGTGVQYKLKALSPNVARSGASGGHGQPNLHAWATSPNNQSHVSQSGIPQQHLTSPPATEYHMLDSPLQPTLGFHTAAAATAATTAQDHLQPFGNAAAGNESGRNTPYESHSGGIPFPSLASYQQTNNNNNVGFSRSNGLETIHLPYHDAHAAAVAASSSVAATTLAPSMAQLNLIRPHDASHIAPSPALFATPSSAGGPFTMTTRSTAALSATTSRAGGANYNYITASPSAAAQPFDETTAVAAAPMALAQRVVTVPLPPPSAAAAAVATVQLPALPGTVAASTPLYGPRAIIVTRYDDNPSPAAPAPSPSSPK